MKHLYKIIFLFLLVSATSYGQQVRGYVYDETTHEVLPGVNIYYKDQSETVGVVSDIDGLYEINLPEGGTTLVFSYLGYKTQSYPLIVGKNQTKTLNVSLQVETQLMKEVVVSVGRYEQKLSEITVSMEVLKAPDIAKQVPTDLSAILKTIPGVEVTDRQPTIRGGSGWTYGVGSRSLILIDGMPALTPGSGEINWNVIPMENIEQVEVLKGASSVLYGSSALNGLINVRTKRPGLEPSTRINTYAGIYGNPKEESYKWWEGDYHNPIYTGVEVSHARRINRFDLAVGLNYFKDEGYRSDNDTERFRIGGNLTYHDPRVRGLNYGVNANYLTNDYTGFFIWRSPREAYQQSPLANMGRREYMLQIDPFLNYINEEKGTTHRFKGRFFRRGNKIVTHTTDKNIFEIANNMGFDYNNINEIVDLGQNWQTKLLPRFLPYLPQLMNGDVNGLIGEAKTLLKSYFPTGRPADYMDLVSWVMGHTPLPASADQAIPWLTGALTPQSDGVSPTDYTTSYYMDYQFSKKFTHSQLTVGTTYDHVYANSAVTGRHRSDNAALFAQYDHKFFDRLNVSVGGRLEYFRIDESYREAETAIFGMDVPVKPVFRGGLNYELAEYSFLRASFGQGYRYPSVVEKHVLKDIGGIGAFPNAELKAESGYNAEIGIKQGYRLGNLQGFVDMAGFYTRYKDMIEFRLGLFDKSDFTYVESLSDLITLLTGGIDNMGIGAQFVNAGRAEIYGVDLSTTGAWLFNPDTRLTYNLGYVYTRPIDMDVDERNAREEANTDLLAMRSKSNDSRYLKYRQKHSLKGVFDLEWKNLSIGTNLAWKSKTLAVDYFMVDERIKEMPNLWDHVRGLLFGDLHTYWTENNTGHFTMDLRMGVRITKNLRLQGMINNLLNTEYSVRPMDVSPPRTFVVQLSADF